MGVDNGKMDKSSCGSSVDSCLLLSVVSVDDGGIVMWSSHKSHSFSSTVMDSNSSLITAQSSSDETETEAKFIGRKEVEKVVEIFSGMASAGNSFFLINEISFFRSQSGPFDWCEDDLVQ